MFAIVLFFFFNETVHRDGFFNHIENAYSSNHLWDSYWTEQDLKKKKVSAATENYLHVHFKVDTSSSSVSSMLAPEWTVLAKLNLALFNIVFGVAFTMNQ